jgi:hypothetical protein
MSFRSSIFIPNPIEEVFDFAVDQVGASRWQYQVGVKHLSGEENAPGSTYQRTPSVRGKASAHSYELDVVASPYRFNTRSIEGAWFFHYDYTFVVEDQGTRVFVDFDSEGESPADIEGRLMFLRRNIAGEAPELAPAHSTSSPGCGAFWSRGRFGPPRSGGLAQQPTPVLAATKRPSVRPELMSFEGSHRPRTRTA